ncbi:MAG: MarR family transcriptional regulator [Candidatus Diapherotrites archaeon]|nr:MarR family transcriptional regulator [Candidatus Diapherotrites archaeon]
MVLVPAAFASATIPLYISSGLGGIDLYGYAQNDTCIAILSGHASSVQYILNGQVNTLDSVGDYVCIPAGAIFVLRFSGPMVISTPSASVSVDSSPLYRISWHSVGDRTIVTVTYGILPFVLAGVFVGVFLAVLYVFLHRRRSSSDADVDDRDSSVVQYIASHPGCTQKEIATALGLQKYQVSRILSRLERDGVVVRVKRGISKRVYLREQLQ